MANDTFFPLTTIDLNVEGPTITAHELSARENDPTVSVSQQHEQKPSSCYVTSSGNDNRRFSLSDFQDPLFYQQPLHLHCNQLISSNVESGHETGDRVRAANEIASNKHRKRNSISSSGYGKKRKLAHRQPNSSSKTRNKMATAIVKAREKKKNISTGSVKNRKRQSKKICRSGGIQQHRLQSKSRRERFLKRHRQPERSLQKKKKRLKQHIISKKQTMSNVSKKKSFISTQHDRKLNMTNNRVASTISPRRSLISGTKMTRSINQSKIETTNIQPNKNRSTSITQLMNDPNTQITSNKIMHRTNMSTLNSISQSDSKQMLNIVKHHTPTPSNILSKVSSSTKLGQKSSKKNLLRSRLNVRKVAISKSKQGKRRNRGAKLTIRSPTHTTFKTNIRHHRQRRSKRRKAQFPRCTSKTLITIAPRNSTEQNFIKSINLNNEHIQTRTSSPSLFSFRNSSNDKLSSTSTVMPLTNISAQLTSKNNNNRRALVIRNRQSRPVTAALSDNQRSTKTGMTLRSRTIIINKINTTKRKGKYHK